MTAHILLALLDASDNLYGTTQYGGASEYGTVFKLAPDGKETQLYNFQGGADGSYPRSGVISDANGNFYGTTFQGGNISQCYGGYGCGTVFEIGASGTKTTLYTFCSQPNCTDGTNPSGLTMDASGNLYGVTEGGGSAGYGAVFKLTPDGTESVLYSFPGGDQGFSPNGPLIMDASGNLYGTTANGGVDERGTVYRLAPDGTLTTLYVFTNNDDKDGLSPLAGLVMDKKGNLYGTTGSGGDPSCKGGCGVVFEVTSAGIEKVLYAFAAKRNGAYPEAGLLLGKHNELFGTTSAGGNLARAGNCLDKDIGLQGCGVVFEVKK